MKKRVVFRTDDMAGARAAMDRARTLGIADDDMSLIARSDKSDLIPDDRKVVEGDFYPAAAKGVAGGAAIGLIAGLVAIAIPPLGITMAGALAMTAGGGALGAWSTALAGSAVEDPVSRKFKEEVEAGNILLIIDSEEDNIPAVRDGVAATGAVPLPFERASALS